MTALKKRSPPGRRGAIDAVLLASYSNYTYESNVRRRQSIEHSYGDKFGGELAILHHEYAA